ncbi:MAG: protein kinase [Planctomycetaceae bacterium]|nr:protein kinase [Planctomycetaceae bacterium]
MPVQTAARHLSSARLKIALSSETAESSSGLSDVELTHLELCPECRQRMAEESGEGQWLTEFCDAVQTASLEELCDTRDGEIPGGSVVQIVLDSSAGDGHQVDASRVILDFLESAPHPELLGRLGRYDIERLVGSGGFGVVLKAFDTDLHRVVALKVLAPHLMTSGAARKRFAREAQAAAAIQHENVIPIFDVVADDRVSYLVMQFIAGNSLQERVDRQGPLSVEETLRIAAQIAAGLAAAHVQGVVHRDVKPANVMLESSLERVLLSDFGLAQTTDDAALTRSGIIAGTPHYMSPEQSMGETVDARTDLFSLGSVMYFMLAGHPPFRARQVMAVLNQICHRQPKSLEQIRSDVPFDVLDLIERLLNKNPQERYANAQRLHEDLLQLLSDLRQGKLRRPSARSTRRRKVTLTVTAVVSVLACLLWFGYAVFFEPSLPVTVPVGATPRPEQPEDVATATDPIPLLPSSFWTRDGDPWYSEVNQINETLSTLEQRFAVEPL